MILTVFTALGGGCSSIDEMFEPEPEAVTAGGAPMPGSQGVPGKDQPTPNLASVPDQAPKSQTTAVERQKIADQLIADNRQVQYAEKVNKPEQIEVAPPARTPTVPNKGKTEQKSDTPAKAEPGISTTAPSPNAPSAPTASVQMGAASTQGAAPAVAAPAAVATGPNVIASNPGSPSTTALSPTPPPTTPAVAGMPMPGARPTPPPLPPVLQEAQAPTAAPPPSSAPAAPAPAAPPPAATPAGQPDTVVISGRSARPLTEYVRKSAIAALVATIYFPENSAQIKPEDVTVLRQLALEQAKRSGTFRVVSVARSTVADARAQEIAKILIDRGVNPGRVYAGTIPQTDPTFGQPRSEADPSNRRVDVYLDY